MSQPHRDPVRDLEHTHEHLTKLAARIGRLVEAEAAGAGPPSESRERLIAGLDALREELLRHFANEEEALFPFVRATLPSRADAVDRLERAHDSICGAIVRLVHLSEGGSGTAANQGPALEVLYRRFESAYAQHSADEADLFAQLGRALDETQRAELSELLRGL